MELLETIRLGCDNDDIAEIGNSELVRFDITNSFSHSTIIVTLSQAFLKAQLLYDEKATNGPVHLAVVLTFEDHKRKEVDTETTYQRIRWFINAMRVPDCGLVISIYHNPNARHWVIVPWQLHFIWPFKDQWEPKGKYITAHWPEAKLGGTKKEKVLAEAPLYLQKVEEAAERYGYDIKWFSYAQPWQEIYDGLRHSDHHFTYIGSTYYFAGSMGTPTTGFSYSSTEQLVNGSLFDYDTGKCYPITTGEVRWGSVGLNRVRILQYDFEKKAVWNKPAEYVKEISTPDMIDHVFQTEILK